MSLIEIIIAIVVIGIIAGYVSYVLGFFSIIPASIMALLVFAIALDVVLFIIHRK